MPYTELTPLPNTRPAALRVLQEQDVGAGDLAALVEVDPSLTAAVLRRANSTQQFALEPAVTAQHAVVRIGVEETRRLVAGLVLHDSFDGLSHAGIDTTELWRHLVAVALLADAHVGGTTGRGEPFAAGLLHDIGRMAMANFDPDRYRRVVEVARQGLDVRSAESLLFGAGHTDWGVRIGWEWGLPPATVAAIAEHHQPRADQPLALAVAHGREVAGRLGIGDGVRPPPELDAPPGDEDVPGEAEGDVDPDAPDIAPTDPVDPLDAVPLDPADEALLRPLGGRSGLIERVEAFRHSLAA